MISREKLALRAEFIHFVHIEKRAKQQEVLQDLQDHDAIAIL